MIFRLQFLNQNNNNERAENKKIIALRFICVSTDT